VLKIDGSQGEGGGQLLRTSLTLSILTGRPFRMTGARARRRNPGLQPQHLAAVEAARRVSGARVDGVELDSQVLSFSPGLVWPDRYEFDIGTAGSCTLVLQTVLLPLALAPAPSTVRVTGGTHNVAAPPFEFLAWTWLPLLARMGVRASLELVRRGFYPRGGGEVLARIQPGALAPLAVPRRGRLLATRAEATVAGLPRHIAERELAVVAQGLSLTEECLRLHELPPDQGPGNVITVTVESDHVTEVFAGFGQRGVPAETVAEGVCVDVRRYLDSGAAAGPHLADQLLLPLAVAGGGVFTTSGISSHFRSNAALIAEFLPARVETRQEAGACRVTVTPDGRPQP